MSETPDPIVAEETAANIVETFRRERTPMSVTIGASDTTFTSRLLRLRLDTLQIDQLVPEVGDQLLQPGMSLCLKTAYEGVAYWFYARHLEQAVDERGHSFHLISRPARVESEDKRSKYRIHTPLSEHIFCRVSLPAAAMSPVRLEDISEGGACVRLPAGEPRLQTGDMIEFSLEFEQFGALDCQARVRYLQPLTTVDETRAGVSFSNLPASETNKLRRILMKLQRRNIKTCLPT